jgi:nitrogen regulatory protein P-II 1
MRAVYKAGAGGITAYNVHGLSGETASGLYTHRPFELNHLPEAVKLEVICSDESSNKMMQLIARCARTGNAGDGIIAVQEVTNAVRIRDMKLA